jgi:hypothetical protein
MSLRLQLYLLGARKRRLIPPGEVYALTLSIGGDVLLGGRLVEITGNRGFDAAASGEAIDRGACSSEGAGRFCDRPGRPGTQERRRRPGAAVRIRRMSAPIAS